MSQQALMPQPGDTRSCWQKETGSRRGRIQKRMNSILKDHHHLPKGSVCPRAGMENLVGRADIKAKRMIRQGKVNVPRRYRRVKNKVNMAASDIVVAVKETDPLVRKHYKQN